MEAQGLNETKAFAVDKFHVLDNLPNVAYNFRNDATAKRYSHLNNLTFPRIESCQVEIIFGMNAHKIFYLSEQHCGEVGEPLGSSSSSSYGRVAMIQVRREKRMGTEGLSFYHPSLLSCLDQMLAVTELSQHLVSSSKTVRPIISRSARCMGHVKIMWSTVCSLAPHSHFAEKARPHLCRDEPKRPTLSTYAIEFDPSCSGQTDSNKSCADPRNVDIKR